MTKHILQQTDLAEIRSELTGTGDQVRVMGNGW